MQMTLGSKGDYSVRAVLDLARAHGGTRRKAREISNKMDIPPKYLPQVLGDLIRAGLVESVAGPGGGYSLSRPPRDISLLQVVEAAEGPVRNPKCLMRGGPCHWDDACPLHAAWADAQEKMVSQLAKTNFAQLARRDTEFEKAKARNSEPAPTAIEEMT